MKKYKIVNKFRFISFVVTVLLIMSFSTANLFGLLEANGAEKIEYSEVQVVDGDTIWQLAKMYGNSSKDIREVIFQICKINNIKADTLKAGQTILIPKN